MIKVAFFVNNSNNSSVDLSHPEMGNPGCGGTEYMLASIPHYLNKITENYELTIFSPKLGIFSKHLSNIVSGDVFESLENAILLEYSYFIYKPAQTNEVEITRLLKICNNNKISLIPWFQLTPRHESLTKMALSPNFKACVCVEHEQLDLFRDHPIHPKTVIIPNSLSLEPYMKYRPPIPFNQKENHVIFLGSLVKIKGFERLAKAWPTVLKKVPNAKLLIAGTGKLYNQKAILGEWGVAEESYERKHIRPFLSDPSGKPHPSVSFLGILGEEKVDYIAKSKVGIANPVGWSETFCISAIEIQAAGTPVIAGARGGLFDTVLNGKTGYLISNEKALAHGIIELLSNEQLAHKMVTAGLTHVQSKYDIKSSAEKWKNLLYSLEQKHRIKLTPPKKQISGIDKYYIRFNSFLINKLKLPILPSYTLIHNRLENTYRSIRHFYSSKH